MRKILLLAALGALAACSSSSNTSSSGSTGTTGGSGSTGGTTGSTTGSANTIAVSGTLGVHPLVSALQDAGLLDPGVPPLGPQTLYIDEPLQVIANGAEAGRLATTTVDASGNWSAPTVPTDSILIGLVGTLASTSSDGGFQSCYGTDAGPAFCGGWARAASLIWEDWLTNPPAGDISGVKLVGVPVSLTELLSAKFGSHDLLDEGFVLGYVVDASGHPVSGVTFTTQNNSYQVVYFDDQLNTGATSTNKFGMFIITNQGLTQPDPAHTFGITGHPEFKCHKVGTSPGTVFSLIYDANSPGIDCK